MTLGDLRRSPALRSLILDYNLNLFHSDPQPQGSFKRTYENKKEEEVALEQSARQSQTKKEVDRRAEVDQHNFEIFKEYN